MNFKYTRCTPQQFLLSLFNLIELQDISLNGSYDWIPLDTQSVINMYPDYKQKPPIVFQMENGESTMDNITSDDFIRNSVGRGLGFDWGMAHLEEALNSISPGHEVHFNMYVAVVFWLKDIF